MSASDQSVVSTRYRECEFPEPARLGLISQGAKPIKAVVWERENHVAYGMFSEDTSGENGEMEKHLSVSASTRFQGRRMPTFEEVEEAAKAVGLDLEKCQISKHMLGVHLFCSSC
jgi:hypothetical protein